MFTQRYLTDNLFYETTRKWKNKAKARYTLRDTDFIGKTGKVYPSLYKLYIEEMDVTEWNFAEKHLDSYQHWMALCQCEWFTPYALKWREALEMKMKAKAMDTITFHANDETKHSYEASKFIATSGWKQNSTSSKSPKAEREKVTEAKRGRPSKAEIQANLDEATFDMKRMEDDLQRIVAIKSPTLN